MAIFKVLGISKETRGKMKNIFFKLKAQKIKDTINVPFASGPRNLDLFAFCNMFA